MNAGEREHIRSLLMDLAERPDPMRTRGNARGKVTLLLHTGHALTGWIEVVGEWDAECVQMQGSGLGGSALVPVSAIAAVVWNEVAA